LVLLCGEHHRALHDGYFLIESLGHQRFTFRHPSGAEMVHAPALSGDAEVLRRQYQHIEPDAIVPNWGGEGLDLSYATDVLITNWQQAA
jgi:hypothetical protein